MPWTCPACRLAIRHSEHEHTPRQGVTYRCHVCRLELVVDTTEGTMTLAPFRYTESESSTLSADDRQRPKQKRRKPRSGRGP
jgi:hypothetical protein